MSLDNTKRISVLIPSFNHARFVERCVRSIVNQTVHPAELLVIDDGSTDGSAKIIEKALLDCPFSSELIVNPNKGLCATLNEGLSKTTGEYFAYLGSDDLWLPEFLASRLALLESRPNAVLGYGHGYLIDDEDRIFECSADWKNFAFPDGDPRPMLYLGTAPISSTVFYRRSTLEKRGWNEKTKLEDYELYLQLAEDGDFAFDSRVLAAWRRHSQNTSGDLDFMLTEVIAAQERVGGTLKWNAEKLQTINTRTRFFFAGEFDRAGNKPKAWSLLFGNLSGATSAAVLFRALVRILVPASLLLRRRSSAGQKNIKEYGTVKI